MGAYDPAIGVADQVISTAPGMPMTERGLQRDEKLMQMKKTAVDFGVGSTREAQLARYASGRERYISASRWR